MKATKNEVYNQIVRYLTTEGFPWESTKDFKEANVNNLVQFTTSFVI